MRPFPSVVAALAAVLICGISQADAAVTIEREVPVDIQNKPYTVAQDGSVWTTYSTSSSTGLITHLDGQNGSILASFNIAFNGYDHPQSIGYANNRVYIVQTPQIYSFRVDGPSGTTNPGLVFSDGETGYRLGSTQAFLRVGSDGIGTVAEGQNGEVGVLDLNDVTSPSFYPQTFYGPGINGGGSAFEVCHVDSPPASPGCGIYGGGFNYATDTAPDGDNGFFVTEYSGNQVTHVGISLSGYTVTHFGSGPGPAAGQLSSPTSIRRIPDTGRLVISNPPNRRLDEFSPTGDYERSYGFGVLTGADEFETCGVGIGTCDPGVPYASDSRSYFTQLDIVDGKLYAGTPLDHSIQVIDLGSPPSSPEPPPSTPPSPSSPPSPSGGGSLDLKVDPVKIKQGKKATLTAKLENCDDGDSVSFQRKEGSAFDDVGSAKAADDACKAKKRVKIKETSIFRAVAQDSTGATIATSNKVKVSLK
jgi:hypothetical protein